MSWNPPLAVSSVEPIIDNLRAEVLARQVAALAWASPSKTLPPFTKFYRSFVGRGLRSYPHLFIVQKRPTFTRGDDDIFVSLELLIEGEIFAEGPAIATIETHALDVVNYWRALDSIIRNISMDALLHGASGTTNTDKSQVDVLNWDVIPSQGGPVSDDSPNAKFINAPQMAVRIQYWERANG